MRACQMFTSVAGVCVHVCECVHLPATAMDGPSGISINHSDTEMASLPLSLSVPLHVSLSPVTLNFFLSALTLSFSLSTVHHLLMGSVGTIASVCAWWHNPRDRAHLWSH